MLKENRVLGSLWKQTLELVSPSHLVTLAACVAPGRKAACVEVERAVAMQSSSLAVEPFI